MWRARICGYVCYEKESWDGVKDGTERGNYCMLEVIEVLRAVSKEMGAFF